ncbi:MAG: hypothetical protein IJ806_00120 [Ruminococcus sp.]|nr:hypothetical protein [Ruminococcus sp.]
MANYTEALCLYKNGRTKSSMYMLGRALHFIGDMGCTPHVANMAMTKRIDRVDGVHLAYEKHINIIYGQFRAESFDKRLMKGYEKEDMGDALNKLVRLAGRSAVNIATLDPRAFAEAAGEALPAVHGNMAAVMLRFYDDCHGENGGYVLSGRAVGIKNEGSGLFLTVGKKGLAMSESAKTPEVRFTPEIGENGTFALKGPEGNYLSGDLKRSVPGKKGEEPPQFRFTALGRNRFLISSGRDKFTDCLTVQKGGRVGLEKFTPEEPSQIWTLI